MRKKSLFLILIVFIPLLFTACQSQSAAPAQAEPTLAPPTAEPTLPSTATEPPPTEPPPTETPTEVPPTATPAPTDTPEPTPTATVVLLPAEPQKITFKSFDGSYELQGMYYPAAVNPAPVIVLMHWAPGDQSDWVEIAYWLQNRGLGGNSEPAFPWLDPSWFPPMPEGASYAVFTFTFSGCEGGCKSWTPDAWEADAFAALAAAATLEGVDPSRILAAGASIGADGAPVSCMWLNTNSGLDAKCVGAYSFSPGSYLVLPYPAVIAELGALNPPVPVHCLYAKGDKESASTCEAASGDVYQKFAWEGEDHGMTLIRPGLEPLPLQLFLEFIQQRMNP